MMERDSETSGLVEPYLELIDGTHKGDELSKYDPLLLLGEGGVRGYSLLPDKVSSLPELPANLAVYGSLLEGIVSREIDCYPFLPERKDTKGPLNFMLDTAASRYLMGAVTSEEARRITNDFGSEGHSLGPLEGFYRAFRDGVLSRDEKRELKKRGSNLSKMVKRGICMFNLRGKGTYKPEEYNEFDLQDFEHMPKEEMDYMLGTELDVSHILKNSTFHQGLYEGLKLQLKDIKIIPSN